jgi:hypothetical protein
MNLKNLIPCIEVPSHRDVKGKEIGKLHTLTSALDGGKQLKVLPALCPCQQPPGTIGQLAGYVTQSVMEAKVHQVAPLSTT